MKKIIVLGGGWSREREVSLKSMDQVYTILKNLYKNTEKKDIKNGKSLLELLKKVKKDTLVFPCLHGRGGGEDGAIQSFLDLHKIRYVGSGPKASSLALDKIKTKKILAEKNIPVLPHKVYSSEKKPSFEGFGDRLIVKPINEGSSIETYLIAEDGQWENLALKEKCFVEPYVAGRELTVGVVEEKEKKIALGAVEVAPKNSNFYNYKSKYTLGETEYIKKPKNLNESIIKNLKEYALIAHKSLGCKSFSRSDFIVDNQKIWYLETNTIPGMTKLSLLPLSAKAEGLNLKKFLMMIISNYE